MKSHDSRQQFESQRRALMLVAITGERAVIPSYSAMPSRHRGGWMLSLAFLATAVLLIALLAAPPVARVTGANPTAVGPVTRAAGGEVEYFAARFDERSLPAVPQPGQFSLTYGE